MHSDLITQTSSNDVDAKEFKACRDWFKKFHKDSIHSIFEMMRLQVLIKEDANKFVDEFFACVKNGFTPQVTH